MLLETMKIPMPRLAALLSTWLLSPAVVICAANQPPSLEASAPEPVRYVGTNQPDKWLFDGGLRHAVGARRYQAFRANRTHPAEGGKAGWTYNHQPFLAYWNHQFYLDYLSDPMEEHHPPGRTLLMTSKDGRQWSAPVVLFPVYALPEIKRKGVDIPAGTPSVMHQRMSFYVAPNGRLLASGFYSYCATPRNSPNTGNGLGRVVREIHKDGSFGPIYFIRYNRHAGFDEHNTSYPFYQTSQDQGFLDACESLLNNKLVTLQWWEEDRAKDGFFSIDPGDVKNAFRFTADMTTSAGAGKAFCWYHRPDGVVVGLWKNQYSVLSPDDGKTWTGITRSKSLMTCGAKVWGQRTADNRYALVYDHSATRANRYPMIVMTGDDGHDFNHMLCVEGEVPPMRYRGIWKGIGPQYFRGIAEGNGNPPGHFLWITYSVNKEDIWVSRVTLPIRGTVDQPVRDDFNNVSSVDNLDLWSLHVPLWAPISIARDPAGSTNQCLELRDQDPYDQAVAERAFPSAGQVRIEFRVYLEQLPMGRTLEFEVQSRRGGRPLLLRFDNQWLSLDTPSQLVKPLPIKLGRWFTVALKLDCATGSYDLGLDGEWVRKDIAFAEKVEALERMVFRTGPYHGHVPVTIVDGEPQPSGLYIEDRPGADERLPASVFLIDDVRTK